MARSTNEAMARRISVLRRKGLSLDEIAMRVGLSRSGTYHYYEKAAAKPVARASAPAGLNGLGKVWAKAEKLIEKAKRIKAAVKELHKVLHG